ATLPLIPGVAGNTDVMSGGSILGMLLVRVLRQAHVFVAAGVVALPQLLAVREGVGSEAATRGELIAAEADQHLAFGNEGRGRDGLALVRVGVFDHPHFLASGRIECDHEAVERAEYELAVRE